jgi:hypothetical protein
MHLLSLYEKYVAARRVSSNMKRAATLRLSPGPMSFGEHLFLHVEW